MLDYYDLCPVPLQAACLLHGNIDSKDEEVRLLDGCVVHQLLCWRLEFPSCHRPTSSFCFIATVSSVIL